MSHEYLYISPPPEPEGDPEGAAEGAEPATDPERARQTGAHIVSSETAPKPARKGNDPWGGMDVGDMFSEGAPVRQEPEDLGQAA